MVGGPVFGRQWFLRGLGWPEGAWLWGVWAVRQEVQAWGGVGQPYMRCHTTSQQRHL